jgi:hypothetical protein
MATLQKVVISVTVTVLAGVALYQTHQGAQLRHQIRTLQQQQAPLAAQIQELKQQRDDTTDRLAAIHDGNEQSNRDVAELLRLRSEVTRLRSDLTNRLGADRSGVRPPIPNAPYSRYYYDFAPLKAARRAKLASMSERLGLSAEQRQSIEGVLTNLSNKDPESQIKALLSPEQQAAYQELEQEEVISNTRASADAEVIRLRFGLRLTTEQQAQMSQTLYDVELTDTLARMGHEPGDLAGAEQLSKKKFNALTNILSPAQLDNFSAWQADDLQQMKKVTEQLRMSPPPEPTSF